MPSPHSVRGHFLSTCSGPRVASPGNFSPQASPCLRVFSPSLCFKNEITISYYSLELLVFPRIYFDDRVLEKTLFIDPFCKYLPPGVRQCAQHGGVGVGGWRGGVHGGAARWVVPSDQREGSSPYSSVSSSLTCSFISRRLLLLQHCAKSTGP